MPGYIVKPYNPEFRLDGIGGESCTFLVAFDNPYGASQDLVNRYSPTVVGSLTFGSGHHGPVVSGFSASNYINYDSSITSTYNPYFLGPPYWQAVLFQGMTSGIGSGIPVGIGSSTSLQSVAHISVSANGGGQVNYVTSDAVGTVATASSTSASLINNGLPHVVMGVSYSLSDHRIYVDGQQRGTSTTTLSGSFTPTRIRVGTNAVAGAPFPGQVCCVAFGRGSVPDPLALADDWISGLFSIFRSKEEEDLFATLIPAYVPPRGRVSQEGLLAVINGTPKGRISQEGILSIIKGTPKGRVSQTGMLVIVPSPGPGGPFPWFLDQTHSGGFWEGGL